MGTDVEGAVLTIVTCARALKAFGERGSGVMGDRDIKEACWGRHNWTIVSELHNKRAIGVHSIFILAVFGVDGGEGGRGVGRCRRRQSCKQGRGRRAWRRDRDRRR